MLSLRGRFFFPVLIVVDSIHPGNEQSPPYDIMRH